MRDFRWFQNKIWDASWHLFAGRPVLTYDIYFAFLLKKIEVKKRFHISTRSLRRTRRDFRALIDDSLILYLGFVMNKYLQTWGNYELLRKNCGGRGGGGYYYYYFLFIEASLHCIVFVCNFRLASFVLV